MKIGGKQHYLWRAVDQDGEVVDVFLQARRDGKAAMRFFKQLQRSHSGEPRKIVTDKLRSYSVAHRELLPEVIHDTSQYANNRFEVSHQPTRVRERGSGACGDSNLPVRLSDSWVCTRWFTIYSILVVIWFLLSSTGTVGEMRLHVGQRQWPNARTRNLTIVET